MISKRSFQFSAPRAVSLQIDLESSINNFNFRFSSSLIFFSGAQSSIITHTHRLTYMSTNEQTNEAGGGTVIFRTPLASGKFPSARGGHSTVVFEGKLIVFGGHYHKGDGVFVYENDTYVLNLRTLKWKLVRTKGDVPRPRYGHSATVFGEEMYVFGGRGKGGKNFRDMDCLNLKTMTWRKIRSANALPPGRSGHSTTLIGDKLVIFGGFDGKHTLDDLWVFNISTTTWMRPKTTGRGPKSSHGHTCILSEEGGLVVFGGYHVPGIMKLPQYLNEVRSVRAHVSVYGVA